MAAPASQRSPVRARTGVPESVGGQAGEEPDGAGLAGASGGAVWNHADSNSRKIGSSIVMSSV